MDDFSCALAETFQLQRAIDVTTRQPCVVWWTSTRPLYLLDLASSWTSRAGGDQALCSGDRSAAQLWTRKDPHSVSDIGWIDMAVTHRRARPERSHHRTSEGRHPSSSGPASPAVGGSLIPSSMASIMPRAISLNNTA